MVGKKICIQTALMPKYYKEFQCLAADCQDDCCRGWRIEFSKKDYLALRQLNISPELKERMDSALQRIRNNPEGEAYARFRMDDKTHACPLQDPGGLCALQLACGHDVLPYVCQTYPRKKNYTLAAEEHSLSPSCEGVLALLWDLPEGVDFVEEPLPKDIWMGKIAEDKANTDLEPAFPEIRAMCVDIIQARQFSMPERMILLGLALRELTDQNWSAPDIEGWCARTAARLDDPSTKELLSSIPGDRRAFLTQNLTTAEKIHQTGKPWAGELATAMQAPVTPSTVKKKSDGSLEITIDFDSTYDLSCYETYQAAMTEALGDREYFFENLVVATVMYLAMPNLSSKEQLWKSYVNLCNVYSFFRFAAVAGCGEAPSRQRLFHFLAMASRALLHDAKQNAELQDAFFQNDSATLAHMAVLVSE